MQVPLLTKLRAASQCLWRIALANRVSWIGDHKGSNPARALVERPCQCCNQAVWICPVVQCLDMCFNDLDASTNGEVEVESVYHTVSINFINCIL